MQVKEHKLTKRHFVATFNQQSTGIIVASGIIEKYFIHRDNLIADID